MPERNASSGNERNADGALLVLGARAVAPPQSTYQTVSESPISYGMSHGASASTVRWSARRMSRSW